MHDAHALPSDKPLPTSGFLSSREVEGWSVMRESDSRLSRPYRPSSATAT